jgi:hypothetical protein
LYLIKVLSLTFVVLVGLIGLHWTVLSTRFYRAAIPEQLELTYSLPTKGSDVSILAAMAGARQQACGGVLFDLTAKTASLITEHGLKGLDSALQGRGYLDPTHPYFHRYTYQPWQETPLPPAWTSEGMWAGLHCMDLSASVTGPIVSAAKAPGSYFTTGSRKMLLVIPKQRLLVYTYRD